MANWHIAYCMQDVHNILLYCNTDVVIIKPVTGRAVYVRQVLNYNKINCLTVGIHKEKVVCQHSHSSYPVPVHTICAICCNILVHVCRSKCIELYCPMSYCNTATY